MRGVTLGLVVSACVGLGLSTCNGPDATGGDVGRAQIALTNVPADGTCVQVVAAAYRTVTRNFQAPAGASSVFEMSGLPVGQVTFTASAFGGACPPAPGTVANWISDAAFTATIAVDPPALVTLNLVRNGNANVSIGFDDGPDGGLAADGGASSGGGAAGASGGSGGGVSTLMQVAGVTGPETTAPFVGWFDLESFQLGSATVHSAASGAGAGAGKTTWSATATLLYQTGVPDLFSGEGLGDHFKTVQFATVKGDPSTSNVWWRATLTDVFISAITSSDHGGDPRPELTITFVFGSIKIEFDGGTNADGTPATATIATFDLTTNTGSAPPNPPVAVQFVVGGPAPMNFEAVDAFHAPSEMTPVSAAGAGAGAAGKPTFSDASITLPVDATVLDLLLEEVAGSVTRTAVVQIDTTTPAAGAAEFGALNFANVLIDGVSFSGLDATVSFAASSFGWSVGADHATSL
jgi:type VI secretion system secreted protein Hcp